MPGASVSADDIQQGTPGLQGGRAIDGRDHRSRGKAVNPTAHCVDSNRHRQTADEPTPGA